MIILIVFDVTTCLDSYFLMFWHLEISLNEWIRLMLEYKLLNILVFIGCTFGFGWLSVHFCFYDSGNDCVISFFFVVNWIHVVDLKTCWFVYISSFTTHFTYFPLITVECIIHWYCFENARSSLLGWFISCFECRCISNRQLFNWEFDPELLYIDAMVIKLVGRAT